MITSGRVAVIREPRSGLVDVARSEQALLTAALGSLFADPDLDRIVSDALDYPRWPLPLTQLPAVAPDLARCTPQLADYLGFVSGAADLAISYISRDGWPPADAPHIADAAWLLLHRADHRPDDRRSLLPLIGDAVTIGQADPRHLALLTDRDRTLAGEAQKYATLRLIRDEQPALLYPQADTDAGVDESRAAIGLPSLADDARFSYAPLIPYGPARSCPTNPWHPAMAALHPDDSVPVQRDRPEPAPDGSVGVYLAATLRYRNQTRRVRATLPVPLVSVARWLDIDPLTRASCQFDAGPAFGQLAARVCLADVARADLVIAFADHRRSHGVGIEIGAALAQRKPVILIGPPRCSFDMLPGIRVVATLDDALAAIPHAAKVELSGDAAVVPE